MKAHVFTGTKTEIAASIARIEGDIHEAIVFVRENAGPIPSTTEDDIFAEMEPFTVNVGEVDDTRQSLYSRLEGE